MKKLTKIPKNNLSIIPCMKKIRHTKKISINSNNHASSINFSKLNSNNQLSSGSESGLFLKTSKLKPNFKSSINIHENFTFNNSTYKNAKFTPKTDINPLQENESQNDEAEETNTRKINYKFYSNYPVSKLLKEKNKRINKHIYYWLCTYDKLMETKNLIKILKYYNALPSTSIIEKKLL